MAGFQGCLLELTSPKISHFPSLRPKHVICGKMFLQQVNTKIYTNDPVKPADCEPDSEEIFEKEGKGDLIESSVPAFKSYFLDLLTHSIPRCHFGNPLPSLLVQAFHHTGVGQESGERK